MSQQPRITDQLRALREGAGMSRPALARLSGVTSRTIFNMEHAAFPPSLDTLQRVASVFGRTVVLSSQPRRTKKQ